MKLSILAACGLATLSTAAPAGVFVVTYTGTILSGTDQTDFFGQGFELTPGSAFTLEFVLDTDTPGAGRQLTADYSQLYGQGQDGNNPFIQSSFTLNGVTVTWSNTPLDGFNQSSGYAEQREEYVTNPGPHNDPTPFIYQDRLYHKSYDLKGNPQSIDYAEIGVESIVNEIVNTSDLTQPLVYDVRPGDSSVIDGMPSIFETTRRQPGFLATRNASALLNPTRVTIAPMAAPVPEPASWAMMIAGFGLVGGALRSRKAGRRIAGAV